MPYYFIAEYSHKTLFHSSNEVQFDTVNGRFAFLSHPLETYGKRTMFILGSLESS